MQPSRHTCLYASLLVLALCVAAIRSRCETLTITSKPPGATVEIDGMATGDTPYRVDYPGGYFHKPHTVFNARLDHAVTLRISMQGYLSQKITLTEGPFEWVSINGRHHGSYFLLRSDHFEIKLEPTSVGSSAPVETIDKEGPLPPARTATEFGAEAKAPKEASTSVKLDSDPSGAEIYVDGTFVGQTPATLRLASGMHRIVIKSPGKKDWERNLDVLPESQLSLHPVLEAVP